MASRDLRSHLVLHRLLLSSFFSLFTYQEMKNPDLAWTDCVARNSPWAMEGVREHTNATLPWGLVSKKCYHQINLSRASWDMGLGVRINMGQEICFDWDLVQAWQVWIDFTATVVSQNSRSPLNTSSYCSGMLLKSIFFYNTDAIYFDFVVIFESKLCVFTVETLLDNP